MSALKPSRQKGFTIIELIIATAVLGTILLLVTTVMINIGKLYYKGINQARIQDTVRGVNDEVAAHLQLGDSFGSNTGPYGEQAYCIGSNRYTYIIGVQIGTPIPPATAGTVYQHVLWRDDNPVPGTCDITNGANRVDLRSSTPSPSLLHGAELIAPRSRLIKFTITGSSPYNLSVGAAYGDNNLLCSQSVSGSCNSNTSMVRYSDYTSGNLLCKGNKDDQFCSTSNLDTTVVRRLP